MFVRMGNEKAKEAFRDPRDERGRVQYRPLPGEHVTEFIVPPGVGMVEALSTVIGAMGHHLQDGESPTWIEADSPELLAGLQAHYGIKPKQGGVTTALQTLGFLVWLPAIAWLLAKALPALRTNSGRDWQCRVMGDPASNATGVYATASWIGVTANNLAPVATNTVLPGEIASGTLARALGTYAHTDGTASYTLTKTFTADQNVLLAKSGVFNAPVGGTLVFESFLNEPAPLVSGDQLQVTSTVTLPEPAV